MQLMIIISGLNLQEPKFHKAFLVSTFDLNIFFISNIYHCQSTDFILCRFTLDIAKFFKKWLSIKQWKKWLLKFKIHDLGKQVRILLLIISSSCLQG